MGPKAVLGHAVHESEPVNKLDGQILEIISEHHISWESSKQLSGCFGSDDDSMVMHYNAIKYI